MKCQDAARVAIVGLPYWLDVGAELLRRANIDHEAFDLTKKRNLARWTAQGQYRKFDMVYQLAGNHWKLSLLLRTLGVPVLLHWCGSDVLDIQHPKTFRDRIVRQNAHQWAAGHVADSPELAAELRELGISAPVVRLLPSRIEAEVEPLPNTFTVLSYWGDDSKMDFFGGNIVLKLSEEFPDIPFLIAGAEGRNQPPRPNVTFLGFIQDITSVYTRSSVLLRLPEHDSFSAMILEMLARGRYVIFNRPTEGCVYCERTTDSARNALLSLRNVTEPNLSGARVVAEKFSLDVQANVLGGVIRDILRRRQNPIQSSSTA